MEITTTKGDRILLDDEDWPIVKGLTWFADKGNRHTLYARAYLPRIDGGKQRKVKMHRLILGVFDRSVQVDHRNGNGLDNRRENLRQCTRQQNNFARHRSCSSAGYKGVYRTPYGTFTSHIRHNNTLKHLGTFKTAEQAALAYNKAADELFGSFAVLNQVA